MPCLGGRADSPSSKAEIGSSNRGVEGRATGYPVGLQTHQGSKPGYRLPVQSLLCREYPRIHCGGSEQDARMGISLSERDATSGEGCTEKASPEAWCHWPCHCLRFSHQGMAGFTDTHKTFILGLIIIVTFIMCLANVIKCC